MGMAFRVAPSALSAPGSAIRLSGRVMGQLCAAEQLVIWACRETAGPAEPGSADRLARGFRLVFGPQRAGAAACSFDGLRRCLVADPARAPRFCPLRCACLSADEDALLGGLAAAQLGDRGRHDGLVNRFVAASSRLQLWRQSRLLATVLGRADLALPDPRLVQMPVDAARH
jgi:hypothetical protein